MLDLRFDDTTTPNFFMLMDTLKSSFNPDAEASVTKLERYCAELFSKEAAIFLPSCSMANIIAICSLTDQSGSVLFGKEYFINRFGIEHIRSICKVTPILHETTEGYVPSETVEGILQERKGSSEELKCVFIENTIVGRGGAIFPLEELKALDSFRKKYGVKIHMDGARLANASVAAKVAFATYGQYVDSITMPFTKGLGAPYGAILTGSTALIEKAKVYRKWFGSPVRSWLLATTALYCLRNRLKKVELSHYLIQLLYNELSTINGLELLKPQTNILFINLKPFEITPAEFVKLLEDRCSIKILAWDKTNVRIIMTPENTVEQVRAVAEAIRKISSLLLRRTPEPDKADKEVVSNQSPAEEKEELLDLFRAKL